MTKKKSDDRVTELTADLQRERAEFQNYKRRSDEARAQFMTVAKREVILELLPVLDDLERALSHLPKELAQDPWAKGIAQLTKRTQESLRNLGVERIDAIGETFDPNLHEAIGYEEGKGKEEIIIEELRPGYRMGDQVIRHAMVKVGRK